MTRTKEIIDKFNEVVDVDKEYTKNELCAILNNIYKEVYSNKKNGQKEKRPPTKYNIFVSENINKLKEEYPELSRQELMKKVGELWKAQKNTEPEKQEEPEPEKQEEPDPEKQQEPEEPEETEKKPKKKVTKKK
jgi:hypothetical protein